ncbi:MAG: ribosome small subunit-dependent GTPase A [Clostridiaceae bacterium]|jgi:ribosome biogenesis GTPase|nr:ribosome small subunit-dependent GTPase A [Clostridiaceae bacterium]
MVKSKHVAQIFKIHSDFYYLTTGNEIVECKVREVLKKKKTKIYVGDFVEFEDNVITSVLKRKNYIARPSVANLDQIIIVSALKEPDLDFTQMNRYLAFCEYYKIPAVLCFNKNDLKWDKKLRDKIENIYNPLGYKTIFTSAKEHKGLKTLETALKDKTSVLCGNSGVGKSSIINAINPNVNLRTKEISEKTQRGTHTTRHCEIIEIEQNTRIVDTPGFSNLKFDFLLPQDVDKLFKEIYPFRKDCKYKNCLHINEDGCAVLGNLKSIDETRYKSYIEFVNEAKSYKEKIKYEGKKIETTQKSLKDKEFVKLNEHKRQSSRNTLKQQLNKEIEQYK